MVIWWPPMVASALAGGLAGGFCWGRIVVAAQRSPAHTMRGFMGDSPQGRRKKRKAAATGTIVAPEGGGGEAEAIPG